MSDYWKDKLTAERSLSDELARVLEFYANAGVDYEIDGSSFATQVLKIYKQRRGE